MSMTLIIALCLLTLFGGVVVFALAGLGQTASIALSIAASLVVALLCRMYSRSREYKAKEQQFCAECLSFGITDALNPGSPENAQRLQLLIQKHSLKKTSPEYLQTLLASYAARKSAEAANEQAEKYASEVRAEQAKYELLVRYAGLRKNEKPAKMLDELAHAAIVAARGSAVIPMKKESDGAVLAGIASGIGGTLPALMSLSATERINEGIRSENAAAKAINDITTQVIGRAYSRASEYREEAKKLATKLTADLPIDELFSALTFEDLSTTVSPLGSVTVRVKVTADPNLTIFNNLPAFVDGSINAEIYDGAQKIGEAVMVFPALGSIAFYMQEEYKNGLDFINFRRQPGSPVLLEGICLNCGAPGGSYSVRLTPRDLWAMEQ